MPLNKQSTGRPASDHATSDRTDPDHVSGRDNGIFATVGRRPRFRDVDHRAAVDVEHGGRTLAIFMPDGFRHLSDAAGDPSSSPSGTAPRVVQPDTGSHRLAAAIAWVTTQIIEGFAVCAIVQTGCVWPSYGRSGEPEHPLLRWHPGDQHRRARSERRHAPPIHRLVLRPHDDKPASGIQSDAVASLGTANATIPGRRAGATALLARLWSRILHRRRVMRNRADWQTLDDRTLRDIGLSRYEVDIIARRGLPWS
jgi:uncharacterized protein YjiS (DUF1127 family)